MPQFEYLCINPKCPRSKERFTLLRSSADMDVVATCPDCGIDAALRCIVPSSLASFRMGGVK